MPRQPRQLAESGIYHVLLRGVNRDVVFLEDADYERFLHSLSRARDASGCVVLAYCLMTNHVHLVVRAMQEPIGKVVQRLGVRYVGYFNHKYDRVGHLFQDRFRSIPVETDAQLVTLVRYVWNNPVAAGLVPETTAYRWSSRRFLDGGDGLADFAALRALLPPDALDQIAESLSSTPAADPPTYAGRPRRRSDEEVADWVSQLSGADGFAQLDALTQRQVIRELPMRSATYHQIATATGLSTSTVRRLHVTGPGGRPATA